MLTIRPVQLSCAGANFINLVRFDAVQGNSIRTEAAEDVDAAVEGDGGVMTSALRERAHDVPAARERVETVDIDRRTPAG